MFSLLKSIYIVEIIITTFVGIVFSVISYNNAILTTNTIMEPHTWLISVDLKIQFRKFSSKCS